MKNSNTTLQQSPNWYWEKLNCTVTRNGKHRTVRTAAGKVVCVSAGHDGELEAAHKLVNAIQSPSMRRALLNGDEGYIVTGETFKLLEEGTITAAQAVHVMAQAGIQCADSVVSIWCRELGL